MSGIINEGIHGEYHPCLNSYKNKIIFKRKSLQIYFSLLNATAITRLLLVTTFKVKYGHVGTKIKSVSLSVRLPTAFIRQIND